MPDSDSWLLSAVTQKPCGFFFTGTWSIPSFDERTMDDLLLGPLSMSRMCAVGTAGEAGTGGGGDGCSAEDALPGPQGEPESPTATALVIEMPWPWSLPLALP